MSVTRDHVAWAYRLFLDREPDDGVLDSPFSNTFELRAHFLNTAEYAANNQVGHAGGRTWIIYETRHNFRIFLTLEDVSIARNIILGRYELSETEFVKSELRPGDLVVDVGANVGYYSLLFAALVAPHGRVIAFEPVPFLHDALVRSIRENRFEGICEAHPVALGEREGESVVRYAEYTVNFGGAFVVTDGTATPPGAVDVAAATRLLSTYVDRFDRCAFVKVDAEGAEPQILRGARDVLVRDRPTIMCELHNAQLAHVSGTNATALIAELAERGYRCHAIEDGARGAELTAYEAGEPCNVVFDAAPA